MGIRVKVHLPHLLHPRLVAQVEVWVKRTCAEQRVPVKLSDLVALRRIADILGEARDA
jgi:hypothetical protein